MDFHLKDFQIRTLDKLGKFLGFVRLYGDPPRAFDREAEEQNGIVPRYRTVPGLETVPYVCLRLPTGGGKTILAHTPFMLQQETTLRRITRSSCGWFPLAPFSNRPPKP